MWIAVGRVEYRQIAVEYRRIAGEGSADVGDDVIAHAADRVLLDRVGGGDERALELLYERYARVVFSFVLARVPDRGTAEEILADVWLGCWRSARAFRGESQVLTWLLGIARRQISSHTRGRHLPTVAFDAEAHDVASADLDPSDLVAGVDQVGALLDALDDLPAELAETVSLAWVHGLPYGEIADALGTPVGTVKSRVSRARRMLRETLGRDDG